MMLLTHLVIALSSLVYSAYVFFNPSRAGLRRSYGLVIATVATGTYLVVSTHSPMLQSCMAGLTYLGIVSVGLVSAHIKLVRVRNR